MESKKWRPHVWELVKLTVPTFIGFFLAYITFSKEYNANEKGRLNENLNEILDINFKYPFVDDSLFIAHWALNMDANNDSSLRYQNYCIYVFNFLQDLCEYYNYGRKDIDDFVDISSLIGNHKSWWKAPAQENGKVFGDKFARFVNQLYDN